MPDFYEDDEPVEDVIAIFDRGEKVRTVRPRGRTERLDVPAAVWPSHGTWTT